MLKSVFILFASAPLALAATVTYNWNIEWVAAAPDGFSRQVIGINGKWPCPPIEATVGDTVVVAVNNKLETQSTGLHFHGINQKGSNIMDGASRVTQCPIPPGSTFTYTFKVFK
jgi:iron transport multicopper oxidase